MEKNDGRLTGVVGLPIENPDAVNCLAPVADLSHCCREVSCWQPSHLGLHKASPDRVFLFGCRRGVCVYSAGAPGAGARGKRGCPHGCLNGYCENSQFRLFRKLETMDRLEAMSLLLSSAEAGSFSA